MPDITTIATVLNSLKSATEIAKFINDSGVSLEKAEVKLKIAELVGALADAKLEIADIQSLILDKDKKIFDLQQLLNEKKSLSFENGVYWADEGKKKDGPFCQRCFDTEQKLIRLQFKHSNNNGRHNKCVSLYCL